MRTFKWHILTIALFSICGALSFITYCWFIDCKPIDTYSNLKNSLFTGFLTVGSFLLSLKTFIIAKQSEILKSDWYTNLYEKYKSTLKDKKVDKFTPLENINNIIAATIFSCFLTSVLHLLLVFFYNIYYLSLCFGLTVGTLFIVIRITFIMKSLTNKWIGLLRDEDKEKNEKGLSAKIEQ